MAWFQNLSADVNPAEVASFAYFHIPLSQYSTAWGHSECVGMNENGGVTPVVSDGGLFKALNTARIRATFVGHDHGNDWCCPSIDDAKPGRFWMCFGRHSGYGGYGHWARGARVLNMRLENGAIASSSWVRLESGERMHEVSFDGLVV